MTKLIQVKKVLKPIKNPLNIDMKLEKYYYRFNPEIVKRLPIKLNVLNKTQYLPKKQFMRAIASKKLPPSSLKYIQKTINYWNTKGANKDQYPFIIFKNAIIFRASLSEIRAKISSWHEAHLAQEFPRVSPKLATKLSKYNNRVILPNVLGAHKTFYLPIVDIDLDYFTQLFTKGYVYEPKYQGEYEHPLLSNHSTEFNHIVNLIDCYTKQKLEAYNNYIKETRSGINTLPIYKSLPYIKHKLDILNCFKLNQCFSNNN